MESLTNVEVPGGNVITKQERLVELLNVAPEAMILLMKLAEYHVDLKVNVKKLLDPDSDVKSTLEDIRKNIADFEVKPSQ